ncbi:MAG TPA: hypothetical protein VGA62_06015, partial [Acidimicrobiia bacterium]
MSGFLFGAVVRADSIATPNVDWLALAPVISLAGAGVLIVLLRALLRRQPLVDPFTLAVAFLGTLAAG